MNSIPESVLNRLKENEAISRKFQEIEISILSILNFRDLCERLLTEISDKFNIPWVWLAIIEESPVSEYIESIRDSEILKSKTTFLAGDSFKQITGSSLAPILANDHMERFSDLFPANFQERPASIAVTPITLDGETVGSINQGDSDINRFEPGMDTSLLQQLAIKISLCLSNVTAHERLKYLAYHDSLTGLLSRGIMEKILEREYHRSKRYRSDLTVIFFDIDEFKSINDTYGHDKGDEALVHVADILMKMKRQSDIVARFAGDEFIAILPSTTSGQAEEFVSRVTETLSQGPLDAESGPFFINLSYGIASSLGGENQAVDCSKTLVKKADERLYAHKKQKKS